MGSASFKRTRSITGTLFVWIFLACLLFSLFVHLLFLAKSRFWVMPGFAAESYDSIVPRTFRMKRVEIDPKTLVEEKQEEKKTVNRPSVGVPDEKPAVMSEKAAAVRTPVMEQPRSTVPLEKPTEVSSTLLADVLPKNEGIEEPPISGLGIHGNPGSTISLPEPKGANDGVGVAVGSLSIGGEKFSNLDDLLSGSGTVTSQTAPILMPTDLLFEYDSDTLRNEATQALSKLGTLIKKNAQASFRIEGHTDSFGTEEYNDQLSLRRAEAVKVWLLEHGGLDAKNVSTAGFGKRHLLVSGNGGVSQQQLNRRVEIVITTH